MPQDPSEIEAGERRLGQWHYRNAYYATCHQCNPDHEFANSDEGRYYPGVMSEADYDEALALYIKRGGTEKDFNASPLCPDCVKALDFGDDSVQERKHPMLDPQPKDPPHGTCVKCGAAKATRWYGNDPVCDRCSRKASGLRDWGAAPSGRKTEASQCSICGGPLDAPVQESTKDMAIRLIIEDEETRVRRPKTPDSVIFYQGPSELDGSPIIAVATGLGRPSDNVKTGSMIQTWIIRSDVNPVHAVKSGDDASVCGSCIHRLIGRSRSCYVNVGQAPLAVFRRFERGGYVSLADVPAGSLRSPFPLRRGSYGDPAAVPAAAWTALEQSLAPEGGTGYTHQWKLPGTKLQGSAMASVDSPEEREQAKKLGYRTFRVRGDDEPLLPGEITCPASAEAGHKTTCAKCKLCGRAGPKKPKVDIAIMGHGPMSKHRPKSESVHVHESPRRMATRLFQETAGERAGRD